jgi:hypothetical protein
MSEVKSQADSWEETAEEQAVRLAAVKSKMPLKVWSGGVNVSYDLHLLHVGRFVFKPKSGEQATRSSIAIGTQYLREAAAYRIDRALGFNLVPITVVRDVDGDVGSAQAWVDAEGSAYAYLKVDEARLATLDYILGNTDRHVFNWRTQVDGRPSAIDNGLCLPLNKTEPLRSRWIHLHRNKELPDKIMEAVHALTEASATGILMGLSIEDRAIAGFRSRLAEVKQEGRITLTAWGSGLRSS